MAESERCSYGLGVKNMSDLVLKEIYAKYGKTTLEMNKLESIKWLEEKFWKVWWLKCKWTE